MNNGFKPLDTDRKFGIAFFITMLVAFVVAYNTDNEAAKIKCMIAGMVSFTTVMYLMAKSVDDHGGWDKMTEDQYGPPDEQARDEDDPYGLNQNDPYRGPFDVPSQTDWKRDERADYDPESDYRPYPRYREFKPLDTERSLGIVAVVVTIASFTAANYLAGWYQVGFLVAGMISFLSIFVLMGRSIDKQNAEIIKRRKDRNKDQDGL